MSKCLIALVVTLALLLSLGVVPVMAQGETEVGTTAVVTGGTTTPPIIKCKWEQDQSGVLEAGDPVHARAGSQFLPPLAYQNTTPVEFWVVVTDPDGVETVKQVEVQVWHPQGAPDPYGIGQPNYFKYQVILEKVDKFGVGIPAYEAARDAGLVTYQSGYTDTEVMDELTKCTAEVYRGEAVLDYHQPAGWIDPYDETAPGGYKVVADACDNGNAWASSAETDLENYFEYLPGSGMEIDFGSVDYGTVEVCFNKWIAGDTVFEEPAGVGVAGPAAGQVRATVRNIGNVEIELMVAQDDMGFGFSGVGPPLPEDWNVVYDIRLGNDPANEVVYYPYKKAADPDPAVIPMVKLPNKLNLCQTEEIDLSIHVIKAKPDVTTYGGKMILGYEAIQTMVSM